MGINTRFQYNYGQSLFGPALLRSSSPMGHQYTISIQLMAIIGVSLALTLMAIVIYPYCLLVTWRAVSGIHLAPVGATR
jgi:hypothetical protein